MIFRTTLTHAVLGSVQISPPDGWKEAKFRLERHEEFMSLIEYFDGSFIFYGDNGVENGGINFIIQVLDTYGFDAELQILIEISFDDVTFPLTFSGLLDLENKEHLPNNKMRVPIIRNDFWSKFISRYDTPVDLQTSASLDSEPINVFDSVNLRMSPQKLISRMYRVEFDGSVVSDIPTITCDPGECGFIQITPNRTILDEIDDSFIIPAAYNPEKPVWIMEAEYEGVYDFDFRIEISHIAAATNLGGSSGSVYFGSFNEITRFYFQLNEDTPIEMTGSTQTYENTSVYDSWPSPPVGTDDVRSAISEYSTTLTLKVGDVIRIYSEVVGGDTPDLFFWGQNGAAAYGNEAIQTGRPLGMDETPTYFRITSNTTFPETNSFGFLIHDAAGQILDRIISRDNSFYSELLGSANTMYRQYESDGCHWPFALLKGLQIRQYELFEKPFFQSFKQWWNGANPILNLGLGYEEINGEQVIRIEGKEHFFTDDAPTVLFSNVTLISKFDQEFIFNKVEIGYKKWESENASGIDDPQTKKTYATQLQRSGRPIQLHSEFIAASLAIETTRRATREKSQDYKFDNDTFIVAINPAEIDVSPETSPDVIDYEPELDENFDSVTNLNNPETRYNLRLTPARNMLRWLNYLNGCLQKYLTTVYRFVSGEGNYDTTTEMKPTDCDENFGGASLSEKQDISPTTDFLFLPEIYEAEIDMTHEDYVAVVANRKNPIGISQTTTGHKKFHIKNLEYEPFKSRATMIVWPKEPFALIVPEDEFTNRCTPEAPAFDQDKWVLHFASDESSGWRGITYGNNMFVAVALSGATLVMTSPDGAAWTSRTAWQAQQWRGVAYGVGLFVAVAANGSTARTMISSDGITWTQGGDNASAAYRNIIFAGGRFVAACQHNGLTSFQTTSEDGTSWMSTIWPAGDYRDVAYGAGLFVAVKLSGTGGAYVATSSDGVTWTDTAIPENLDFNGITFGGGLFVAVASSGTGQRVMTSPDGINWTLRNTPADYAWESVTHVNGLFIAIASSGAERSMISSDGINWELETTPLNQWVRIANNGTRAVAVSLTGSRRVMSYTP